MFHRIASSVVLGSGFTDAQTDMDLHFPKLFEDPCYANMFVRNPEDGPYCDRALLKYAHNIML